MDPHTIAFAGDWHANLPWAIKAVQYAAANGAQVVVHTGDFGYLFQPHFIRDLEQTLARYGMTLLFVDGNHENFDWLYSQPVNVASGLRKISRSIYHIPRATTWSWGGVRFMGLGGAYSIDKPRRKRGMSWWPQEMLTPTELASVKSRGQVDVLISHDCPAEVKIPGLDKPNSWAAADLEQSRLHRLRLSGAVNNARPSLIIHGHYHVAYRGIGVGRHASYDVIGLDCDGTTLAYNVTILTIGQIRDIIDAYQV